MESNSSKNKGIFDDAEIISSYTDEQALADGYLIDITPLKFKFKGVPITRMTNHLWNELAPFFNIPDYENPNKEKLDLSALASAIKTKLLYARGDKGNSGEVGDIWALPPNLWLVLASTGWTLMFPEDY
jgi:hypothetical protein